MLMAMPCSESRPLARIGPQPMEIDFFVAVLDWRIGEEVARLAWLAGYRTKVVHDEEDDAWTCYCTRVMMPTYDGVVAEQRELDELSLPFGGYSDGWGTSGDPSPHDDSENLA